MLPLLFVNEQSRINTHVKKACNLKAENQGKQQKKPLEETVYSRELRYSTKNSKNNLYDCPQKYLRSNNYFHITTMTTNDDDNKNPSRNNNPRTRSAEL